MGTLATLLSLTVAFGAQGPVDARPDFQVRDLIVATSDKKVVDQLWPAFKLSMSVGDLKKLLPSDRFVIRTWGSQGVVALDRRLGVIAEIQQGVDVAKALAKFGGSGLAARIGDLSDGDRSAICDYLNGVAPTETRQDGFDLKDGAVGLDAQVSVTLKDPVSGKVVQIGLPQNNDATRHRNELLAKMPIPLRTIPPGEADRFTKQGMERSVAVGDVEFHVFGLGRRTLPEGLRVAADLIAEVEKDLNSKRARAAHDLVKLLGLDDSLPSTANSVNDLPKSLRDELTASLTENWRAWGLGSPQEAESLLANSNSIGVTTWLGICQCQDPGNPAMHKPGSFRSDLFIAFQGGSLP
ncbi:MAG TPA: hypothetical protein VMI31_16950 [Fimbriimonadaceae bacterium]|nr:hypothetical protein [Fimbriimonadaceae bacterium]